MVVTIPRKRFGHLREDGHCHSTILARKATRRVNATGQSDWSKCMQVSRGYRDLFLRIQRQDADVLNSRARRRVAKLMLSPPSWRIAQLLTMALFELVDNLTCARARSLNRKSRPLPTHGANTVAESVVPECHCVGTAPWAPASREVQQRGWKLAGYVSFSWLT